MYIHVCTIYIYKLPIAYCLFLLHARWHYAIAARQQPRGHFDARGNEVEDHVLAGHCEGVVVHELCNHGAYKERPKKGQ